MQLLPEDPASATQNPLRAGTGRGARIRGWVPGRFPQPAHAGALRSGRAARGSPRPGPAGRVEGAPAPRSPRSAPAPRSPRSARVAPGGTRKADRLRATKTGHVHLLLTVQAVSVAVAPGLCYVSDEGGREGVPRVPAVGLGRWRSGFESHGLRFRRVHEQHGVEGPARRFSRVKRTAGSPECRDHEPPPEVISNIGNEHEGVWGRA